MATRTQTETFKKPDWDRAQVERVRQIRLKDGAVSSEITEDADAFTLTSVWSLD
jgi:hypothetical protein